MVTKGFVSNEGMGNELEWSNLSYVQIDFIEMERQCQRIKDVGVEVVQQINALNAAIAQLAALVGSSVDLSGLTNLPNQIMQMTTVVTEAMDSQIVSYSTLNEEIGNKISELTTLVSQLFDEDTNKITYNVDGEQRTETYQDVLKRYEEQEKLETEEGRQEYRLSILASLTNKNQMSYTEYHGQFTGNLYTWIENNLTEEMKAIGVNSGEEYINKLLLDATANCTSNNEVTVASAVALNKFLYDHDIKLNYGFGDAHWQNYSLEEISKSSDCSSYVSTLIKLGNPDFIPGTTVTLADNSTCIENNYLDLSPGDILMKNPYGADAHVMLFLGKDDNGNYYVTENYNTDIGTRVVSYTSEELASEKYYGYVINYDENAENPEIASDIIVDIPRDVVMTPRDKIINPSSFGVGSMDIRR